MKESERVDDWPESMVDGDAEGVFTVSAPLTVTLTGLEAMVVGVLSVTWSSNDQVPVVDRVPVEVVGLSPGVHVNALPRLL